MDGCKFCLNASTVRPASVLEQIQIAAAAGYEGIELWVDDLDAHVRGGGSIEEVVRSLAAASLAVPTLIAVHGWLGSLGEERVHALEEADCRLRLAEAIGAPMIVASPPVPETRIEHPGQSYLDLLELGEACGVWPAMEFLGFSHCVFSVEQAWRIVEAAGHPHGSVVMDPFHLLRGGGQPSSLLAVPGDRVAIWHWNDLPAGKPFVDQTDGDRVMPGDGVAPLEEIAALIGRQGYSGFVSLELFNESYWQRDLYEVAAEGLEKTRSYFDL
jgi:sugar phosphate isomerase/epimerase